ncbi:unnamed protein product [Rhizoctonia solani]|uniref:Protein kinase domain-containing protein n=1 Tax=Rhizoctonia solani TaxID=456999 RepID=A0A8H2WND9_9AGAM|nr:unnamed protein product [Rhizoctonia solani]
MSIRLHNIIVIQGLFLILTMQNNVVDSGSSGHGRYARALDYTLHSIYLIWALISCIGGVVQRFIPSATDTVPRPDRGNNFKEDSVRVMIASTTPLETVVACLIQHGCRDITPELELKTCDHHPFAQGGYGTTYRATLSNGLVVAIKCIEVFGLWDEWRPSEKSLKHTASELYAWSKSDHPGILKVIGFIQIKGHIFLSIELVAAIDHLHLRGIVHGDIKPASANGNILVSDDGHVQLTDFGSAILLRPQALCFTKTNVKGTLRFMAPEILSGVSNQGSVQADIYATGMQILSGELPYANKNDFQVWASVVNEKSLPDQPDFHKYLGVRTQDDVNMVWNLLKRCWNSNPKDRPTAAEIKDVLMDIEQGFSVPGGFV